MQASTFRALSLAAVFSLITGSTQADYPPNQIDTPLENDEFESGERIRATGSASESPHSGWNADFRIRFHCLDPEGEVVITAEMNANVFEYLWDVTSPFTIPNAAMGGTWRVQLIDAVDTDNDQVADLFFVLDEKQGDIDD
jgi:hypothetical protein